MKCRSGRVKDDYGGICWCLFLMELFTNLLRESILFYTLDNELSEIYRVLFNLFLGALPSNPLS